ncbi:unnamed protein product [Rotaria magnacalcarata]|nr:unnamed protein product [Rotaria magnacalcarata]CAF1594207.1 unnamed protein product [Rotaria magnacalcarata]CAF1940973.1 unnamed protein product [Rotaria magnacalcarata]
MNSRRQITNHAEGIKVEQNLNTSNNEEIKNGQQLTDHDPEIQDKLTVTVLNDNESDKQQQMMLADVDIRGSFAKEFNPLGLQLNGAKTLDQNEVAIALKDFDNTKDNHMGQNRRVVEDFIQEGILNTRNTFNDILADIGPIVGYASEPLLPLYKACAPLNGIIQNILFYVQSALEETSEQPLDGLTIDESAAIRLYTIEWEGSHQSLYSKLNYTLKTASREELRPYFKYLKLFVTALAKLPCTPPSNIWRGVTKDLSAQFPPNTPVTWWSFTSCTTTLTVLENNIYLGKTGNRTLFSVEAINGRSIRAHSHFNSEDEVLLLPGTHMVVQSRLDAAPDLHIIHLKQVIPEEVLLEPPFEGALLYPKTG